MSSDRSPREGTRRPQGAALRRYARLVGIALVALVMVTELRKPSQERTWHGEVLGFVPYDLRPVTLERVRSAFWSPDDSRLLLPRAFGVGWSPNLGRLVRLVQGRGAAGTPAVIAEQS